MKRRNNNSWNDELENYVFRNKPILKDYQHILVDLEKDNF
jgi:hypothetical protein